MPQHQILRAVSKQARRKHVLTLSERMAPTVARKYASNTNHVWLSGGSKPPTSSTEHTLKATLEAKI